MLWRLAHHTADLSAKPSSRARATIRTNRPVDQAAVQGTRRNRDGSVNHELVVDALVRLERPLSAYEIIAALGPTVRMSPVSVYRALDRLIRAGRVHRVESRSAYVLCTHPHADGNPNLIATCEQCGGVEEFPIEDVACRLRAEVRARTFQFASMSVEVRGRCRRCVTADVDGFAPA